MQLEGQRIFITGGAGFIGSHLCERLVQANSVTVYDNLERNALRFTALEAHRNLSVVRGDILDRDSLRRSAEGADVMIHLAAIAGVSNYSTRPVATLETNILGTLAMLQLARELRPRVFANFSSSEVYGPQAANVRETDTTSQGPVHASRWTYSVSKLAAEHLCFAYHREHGVPVVSIRPFNVYGPRQVGEGAIQVFVPQALRNEALTVHDDGKQLRAWCYIDDFVEGCLSALVTPAALGQTINIGNPSACIGVLALAEAIVRLTGSRSLIHHLPQQPEAEIRTRSPNIERAATLLGFKPIVSLEQGLLRTIDWYRSVSFHA